MWEELDSLEGDLETVASAVLEVGEGHLKEEVVQLLEGGGSSLLILNSITLTDRWRGYGVGAFLAGQALLALGDDASCIATYPAPLDGSKGKEREKAIRKLERVWDQLGFQPLAAGVWILDPATAHLQDAVQRLRENFGLG